MSLHSNPNSSDRINYCAPEREFWTDYASAYDALLSQNPAYQDILHACIEWSRFLNMARTRPILDLGAGTGNFTQVLAQHCPNQQFIYVEPDPGMHQRGAEKLRHLSNVSFLQKTVESLQLASNSLSAIVCVHALYTFPNPKAHLAHMSAWLAPGGRLFLCDLGRLIKLWDWSAYLLREIFSNNDFLTALRMCRKCLPARECNALIRQNQKRGEYWLHSTDDIREAVQEAGLEVEAVHSMYRGYSDLVCCVKSPRSDF